MVMADCEPGCSHTSPGRLREAAVHIGIEELERLTLFMLELFTAAVVLSCAGTAWGAGLAFEMDYIPFNSLRQ